MPGPDLLTSAREFALARNLYHRLIILGLATVVMMVLLALAPAKAYFTQWRAIQRDYNVAAEAAGQPPMAIAIQQIWRSEIGLTDRCTTCHVGKGAATPLEGGGALYGAHPDVHHDPGRMGCTLCHEGQGRATTRDAAHGQVAHWDRPLLPLPLVQSACGSCHGPAVTVPPRPQAERGEYLFELHGCGSCHRVDGVGGEVGPDLSGIGLKGYSREWHIKHLRAPSQAVEGSRMMSFGHLSDEEIDALLAYLDTLIGAPILVRGKAIAREAGCRGCHVIGGSGGEHGPSLASSAATLSVNRDFSGVAGEATTENWHREHLRNPAKVSPGSKMPPVLLSPADETAVIAFILSEREPEVPLEYLPRATVMARMKEGPRDYDAKSGAQIFQLYCSACHGEGGMGKVVPSLSRTVPAIANPGTLAMVSDDFLRATIHDGRPGRDMPAWGGPLGLTDAEIEAVIGWLRAHEPTPASWEAVQAAIVAPTDAAVGAAVFAHRCSGCHGTDAEGTVLANALSNAELSAVASDRFLYDTITGGRANTAMPAHPELSAEQLAGLIAWIRGGHDDASVSLDGQTLTDRAQIDTELGKRLVVSSLSEYRATGSAAYGEILYKSLCGGCHGADAFGGLAPAIGNPAFLKVASDGFLGGSILLGRGERAMRAFDSGGLVALKQRDIGDLIAYLRSTPTPEPLGSARVQGVADKGKTTFDAACAGCHGVDGVGGSGPALHDPQLLAAATDGMLQATIARGRPGTGMRAWAAGGYGFAELSPAEINDIVTYIRSWQRRDTP